MKFFLHNNILQSNEYMSIDYPSDMNPQFEELFIEKSYQNNIEFKDNLHYICTLQSKFLNYHSFMREYIRLMNIIRIEGKIVGIGNLCRINRFSKNPKSKSYHIYEYLKTIMKFLLRNLPKGKWVHFYGIGAKIIEEFIPQFLEKGFKVSVDSTKFTKARKNWFKKLHGVCSRAHNRNLYFEHYMNELAINNIIF